MLNIIRSFFYSVALLTLFWVSQQPIDQVTQANWVRAVQSEHMQQASYILTLFILVIDHAASGIMAWPTRTSCTVSVSQPPLGSHRVSGSSVGLKSELDE